MKRIFSFLKWNIIKKTNVSVLRKNKIYLKSRFSRNRQSCRPIVYWSLWINILFITYSTAIFYGFKFNTTYSPWFVITTITLILASLHWKK
jgi:hypothetical protein